MARANPQQAAVCKSDANDLLKQNKKRAIRYTYQATRTAATPPGLVSYYNRLSRMEQQKERERP